MIKKLYTKEKDELVGKDSEIQPDTLGLSSE